MIDITPYYPGMLGDCQYSASVERRAALWMADLRARVAILDDQHCKALAKIFAVQVKKNGRPKLVQPARPAWMRPTPLEPEGARVSRYTFGAAKAQQTEKRRGRPRKVAA